MKTLLQSLCLVALSGVFALGIFIGCSGTGDDDYSASADGDSDADMDADGDADTDADADSDGDQSIIEDPPDTDSETETELCDTVNPVVLYLSADDSNSMASPVQARALIESGQMAWNSIRTYEFLNYYDFDYPEASVGSVSVSAQARPSTSTSDPGVYDLQIGVRSPDLTNYARRPINITLSLDTSGSMSGHPIQMVKESCLAIATSLKSGDIISMVTWSTSQNTIMDSHNVTGPGDPTVVSACNAISSSGGTDLHAGLVSAYQLAENNFSENRINRVVLMSDGGANVGVTDKDFIAQHADDANGEGIYMIGVGMGQPGSYSDLLMDTVTDAGKGAYIFIDSAGEAGRMFGTRFVQNMEVAARDVRVELSMPPTYEMIEFHGEEYSENPSEVDPQHLAYNDAMIYNQTIGSCDPSVLDLDDDITITATFKDPMTLVDDSVSMTTSINALMAADDALLLKGNAIVAYAEALKELKTMSGQAATDLIDQVLQQISDAVTTIGPDGDLTEIQGLLQTYRNRF